MVDKSWPIDAAGDGTSGQFTKWLLNVKQATGAICEPQPAAGWSAMNKDSDPTAHSHLTVFRHYVVTTASLHNICWRCCHLVSTVVCLVFTFFLSCSTILNIVFVGKK